MQETLAQLVFWGHCPSLSSPLSFAPQGYSLTDHCRVSPPLFKSRTAHFLAGRWLKEGEVPKGLPAAAGVLQSSHTLSPSISRDVANPLGQELCRGAQAGTGRVALDPTALWGAAGAGNRSPHLHPARTVLVLPGKGESLLRKKGIYPLLGV